MRKLASFFYCAVFIAVALLPLPSFSYANNLNQITVSATVSEHLTYHISNSYITSDTNLETDTIITSQDGIQYVTVKI